MSVLTSWVQYSVDFLGDLAGFLTSTYVFPIVVLFIVVYICKVLRQELL